jgi:hypothetical protein
MEFPQYENIVQTSLNQGITVIEAGQEGGDVPLVDALKNAKITQPLTTTFRIGYHTILPSDNKATALGFQGDVPVEQHPFVGPNRTMTPLDDNDPSFIPNGNTDNAMIQINHNISQEYIENQLNESPLVQQFKKDSGDNKYLKVVALLHNPEAQIMELANEHDINQISVENRQTILREKLAQAFLTLEQAVVRKEISGYGVASNGLCLPKEHPLALSAETVLQAALQAREQGKAKHCHLSVLQLPINLMERTGLEIARTVHELLEAGEQYQPLKELEIYAMRPLTCYPDRGTGTGHAFRLVDYLLPSGPKPIEEEKMETGEEALEQEAETEVSDQELATKQWSNQMQGPPLIYSIALKKAMSHFDAEFLLEEKLKRDLTAEERETLDGCKLLQSMLFDLDQGLANVRSLGAHEQDLYQRIIPLIHDTFEGYDEETADVLEMFFKSYSLAVRYSIANNTRFLLQHGGDDGKGHKYEELSDDEKLQDFALRYLLEEKAIDKVIVGATKSEQIVEMVKLCEHLDSKVEESTATSSEPTE